MNEDGSKVYLDNKRKLQREAIAKQLLKPSTSHSKVTTGIKKVQITVYIMVIFLGVCTRVSKIRL